MTFADRLQKARTSANLTQKKLSELSGVAQQTLSKIERGEQESTTQTIALAKALNVDPSWLATGKPDQPASRVSAIAIPVIPWDQIEAFIAGDPVEATDELIARPSEFPDGGFALEVSGKVMNAPTGISVPEGSLIGVDYSDQAIDQALSCVGEVNLVLAKLGTEIIFRHLSKEGNQYHLEPLNPKYDPITFTPHDGQILGKIRKAVVQFREV